MGLKEDKLSSTTVDIIRSEGNLEILNFNCHLSLQSNFSHLIAFLPVNYLTPSDFLG